MSRGGFPVQPYFVLGGYDTRTEPGEEPRYHEATAVVLTFIVDNHDPRSDDPASRERLRGARAWEAAFVKFMKEWTADPENTRHMDVAFNSERSIEDELERETSGDVLTIALSYLIMFFYITFSLGQVNSVSSFMVSECGENKALQKGAF